MSEWEKIKLKHLTTKIGSGATPKGGQEAYHNLGISLIRSQNVRDFEFSNNGLAFIDEDQAQKLGNVIVEDGDVLINITGDSVARVCKVPSDILPARVNQHVSIIRAYSEKLDSDFLLYFLLNPIFKRHLLRLASHGATRNALTKSDLENLLILVPSLEEQKSVADVLSCLDRKIENLRKQNETLEAIAQTLFKHWFVDFEFPNDDGKPYKSSGGEMVRSELGEIPESWQVLTLREICETMYRYPQFYGMEKSDKGVPVIRGEHLLPNGKISNDFSDYWFVTDEFSKKFPKTILEKFDVVLSVRGSVGNYSWVGNKHIGVQISPNTIRLSANSKILHNCLLYPYLKGYDFKKRLLQTVSSSAVPAINASEFKTFKFAIPTLSIQDEISPLFKDIYQKIDANEIQTQTLTKARDVLLPKLMSGKLRIIE